jgi:2-polyprenyl-6-methoxyphenol hydroxylase-like FAD-dependent oxidoreductase
MPQWDFLNFLVEVGSQYATFHVRMSAEVTNLIEDGSSVVGLCAETPSGPLEVRTTLVVGADGRHSIVRKRAGFSVEEFGAPMDVLWFRLSRKPGDPADPMGRFDTGRIFSMLNRGDYWQAALSLPRDHWGNFERRVSRCSARAWRSSLRLFQIASRNYKTGNRSNC